MKVFVCVCACVFVYLCVCLHCIVCECRFVKSFVSQWPLKMFVGEKKRLSERQKSVRERKRTRLKREKGRESELGRE